MFELSDELDITVVSDIGIDKKSAFIIDNFYKDPDAVRFISIRGQGGGMSGGMPGNRVCFPTNEIRNLKPLFDQICFDEDIWGRPTDKDKYESSWGNASYMCNFITSESIVEMPGGLIPHQDTYELDPHPNQFGVVIYLNVPEECNGGTSIWSYNGQMTVKDKLHDLLSKLEREKATYEEVQEVMSSSFNKEHVLEMKYNRAVVYPTDILHSAELKSEWFKEYPRIAQVLFL